VNDWRIVSWWVALSGVFLAGCGQAPPEPPADRPPVQAADLPPIAKRPNILWLIAENIKATDLGHRGATEVRTPNLDRLAREGMSYMRVFATAPVCSPSRSALMTGMYQTSIGVHHSWSHRDDDFQLPEGVRPITHWLRDAGYFTANIKTMDGEAIGTGKNDLNFPIDHTLFDSSDWADLKAHQPFYAQLSAFEAEYDIWGQKLAGAQRVKWANEDDNPKIADPATVTVPPYYPDHPITRQEWVRYLDSVSTMDRRFGKVLAKLEADGLAGNTVVIFFADNGRLELRGIHWTYDSGLWVPLIVRWPTNLPAPSQYRPGAVHDRVVSLLDLTATTLAIAGIAKPAKMQSRTLLGPQADAPRELAFSARDRIDETVQRLRSVRSDRYRYIRNYMPEHPFSALNRYKERCFPVLPLMRELHRQGKLTPVQQVLMAPRLPDEELYDSANDPHEIKNLAGSSDPEHQRVLQQLRRELDRWIEETNDHGRLPEPPEIAADFDRIMHEWFGTPAWYKRR
jgi:N-sulfoglucosamine sulfohydrolase